MEEFSYEAVKAFWQSRAQKFGQMDYRSLTFFCQDREILEQRDVREKQLIAELLPPNPERKILEIGCGAGRWTPFLAARSGKVVAFDLIGELVAIARQQAAKAGLSNIEWRVADIREFSIAEQFEVVVAFGVAIYLQPGELEQFAKRALSFISPQGMLLQKEPMSWRESIVESGRSEQLGAHYTCIYHSRRLYLSTFTNAGWQLQREIQVYRPGDAFAPQREFIETRIFVWKKAHFRGDSGIVEN